MSANFPRANYPGNNFWGSNFWGPIIWGVIILGGNCPGSNYPGWQLSGGQLSWGAIVLFPIIMLYKHYTEIAKSYYERFLFSHGFYFVDFFMISGLYQIYKGKSCSSNWNFESNLKRAKNGPKKSTVTQKQYLEIILWLCILRKQKKTKLLSEGSLNLGFKDTKNHIISWFWYIYPILTIELCKRSTLKKIL